ncbi:MAG: hypothetical protein INQ03_10535 [Candidatus Heimdallarchaeota archaeon]|nr:hypothetical protein [Candidatus Heimdallarchaeota archaeon]
MRVLLLLVLLLSLMPANAEFVDMQLIAYDFDGNEVSRMSYTIEVRESVDDWCGTSYYVPSTPPYMGHQASVLGGNKFIYQGSLMKVDDGVLEEGYAVSYVHVVHDSLLYGYVYNEYQLIVNYLDLNDLTNGRISIDVYNPHAQGWITNRYFPLGDGLFVVLSSHHLSNIAFNGSRITFINLQNPETPITQSYDFPKQFFYGNFFGTSDTLFYQSIVDNEVKLFDVVLNETINTGIGTMVDVNDIVIRDDGMYINIPEGLYHFRSGEGEKIDGSVEYLLQDYYITLAAAPLDPIRDFTPILILIALIFIVIKKIR